MKSLCIHTSHEETSPYQAFFVILKKKIRLMRQHDDYVSIRLPTSDVAASAPLLGLMT
jgi:hypothetical protein